MKKISVFLCTMVLSFSFLVPVNATILKYDLNGDGRPFTGGVSDVDFDVTISGNVYISDENHGDSTLENPEDWTYLYDIVMWSIKWTLTLPDEEKTVLYEGNSGHLFFWYSPEASVDFGPGTPFSFGHFNEYFPKPINGLMSLPVLDFTVYDSNYILDNIFSGYSFTCDAQLQLIAPIPEPTTALLFGLGLLGLAGVSRKKFNDMST